jgi:hypothetical protein
MKTIILAFTLLVSALVAAQDAQHALTNADVLKMTKAGMSTKTIILAIQQSPSKFCFYRLANLALNWQ